MFSSTLSLMASSGPGVNVFTRSVRYMSSIPRAPRFAGVALTWRISSPLLTVRATVWPPCLEIAVINCDRNTIGSSLMATISSLAFRPAFSAGTAGDHRIDDGVRVGGHHAQRADLELSFRRRTDANDDRLTAAHHRELDVPVRLRRDPHQQVFPRVHAVGVDGEDAVAGHQAGPFGG
jgi:hypothetical protein